MKDKNNNANDKNTGSDKSFKDLLDRFSGTKAQTTSVKDSAEPDLNRNRLKEQQDKKET